MRQRRAEARLLDTEGKPGQNHTCKFPCMWLVRDNFFGFAWTSRPITKWDAPSSMIEPFRNWWGMGATIPARIQPGSIDHVPFPTACGLVLWRLWLYSIKPAGKRKVFIFPSRVIVRRRCVHRRGNRNASCSAGVASEWECCGGKARSGGLREEAKPTRAYWAQLS